MPGKERPSQRRYGPEAARLVPIFRSRSLICPTDCGGHGRSFRAELLHQDQDRTSVIFMIPCEYNTPNPRQPHDKEVLVYTQLSVCSAIHPTLASKGCGTT